MKIGLISDTHGHFDSSINEYFSDCDEIWHAGDIGKPEVINELSSQLNVNVQIARTCEVMISGLTILWTREEMVARLP